VQGKDAKVKRAQVFYDNSKNPDKHLVIVPDCDDYFRHEKNDKIYSKAPFWAFGGTELLGECEEFPSPEGGIRLVQK
jgi:hypothetical protein